MRSCSRAVSRSATANLVRPGGSRRQGGARSPRPRGRGPRVRRRQGPIGYERTLKSVGEPRSRFGGSLTLSVVPRDLQSRYSGRAVSPGFVVFVSLRLRRTDVTRRGWEATKVPGSQKRSNGENGGIGKRKICLFRSLRCLRCSVFEIRYLDVPPTSRDPDRRPALSP